MASILSVNQTWQVQTCTNTHSPTLSPSATWQMTSPVAGLMVGKVFLLTASCHSLLMKSCPEYKMQFSIAQETLFSHC